MKILHANKYYYLRGGAERYMFDLMRLQEEAGHIVAPFSMHHPDNEQTAWSDYFVSEINTEGVARGLGALNQMSRAFWSREARKKMSRMLRAFEPDICHVHNIYTQISPSILRECSQQGVPVIMSVHDYALVSANYALWDRGKSMDLNHLGLLATARTRFIKGSYSATFMLELINKTHRLMGCYTRYIDRFIAISDFVADVIIKSGIPKNKVDVIYNFVDTPCTVRAGKDRGYVLFFGRLEDYKGVQTLIEAMKQFPNTKLKIVGNGPYERRLRDQAKEMGNVDFFGFVSGSALWDLVAKARVVVAPSIWYEPFGLVVTEAMSCSVPVVVSDVGAFPEIIEGGIGGAIFRVGNAGSLADALRDFINDSTYARSVGEAAKVRANELSDPQTHLQTITGKYQSVIDARQSW